MSKEKKDRMVNHVERWHQSGLTKKDYCIDHQLSYYQFKYWCKQLGYVKERQSRKASMDFISLHPVKQTWKNEESIIEILYPNGVCLKISSSTPLNIIQSLIHSI